MLEIRRVEPHDWEIVREVRLAALRDAPEWFWATYEEEVHRPPGWWQEFIAAGAWFVAWRADEPVGIAAAISHDDLGPGTSQLISMWTAPGARGEGIGAALVKRVMAWARHAGLRALHLDVTEANDVARRLYERCGFRLTGRTTPHPRNADLNELEMRAELPEAFLVVQLSDPHIGATWGAADPAKALAAAVETVLSMPQQPDAVLVCGDLADHASEAEYEQVRGLLSPLGAGVHVAAGNHDDRRTLRRHFGVPGDADDPIAYAVELGPLKLVVLDTTIPGDDPGELGAGQLEWLDTELASAPEIPTLVAMHHPPLVTGIPSCDESGLRPDDRRALGQVVDRHPQVRTLAGGHVHRAITSRLSGRPVVTSPSTYVQLRLSFAGTGVELAEREPAGFVVHALLDGEITSHVQPVLR